ncbi:MAG: alpha/beta hydrolase [Candidatus Aeolococcus gillhamiae]|uniref:Alpha/beta hydrolase n=1 Tax=Candidatus Aeolococcus gillhamiae TaxID=3127015 RepID=A0A2W5YZQ3_9BACT|nr:MAG: alpha/beta hydrolase [Candidatus Dormibacter sp. RRmetagenome_bin12]
MTETRVAAPDGAELAVTVIGDGPPLLLIPGLGATRVVFDPIVALLAPRFRVAVYDQRGIGASQLSPGPYSTAQLGDDAATVLDGLEIDQATVLGASFGGMVAQQLVVRHPDRVATLLLAATGPGGAHLVREPDPSSIDALLGKGARTPADAYRIACTVLYSGSFQEEHADFIEQQVRDRAGRPVAARAFQAQLAASRGHDVWEQLRWIAAPTMVMHGSEDAVMPLANAEALAARVPRAVLDVFDGAGHLFFHEQPERTAQAVDAFAAAHG